MTSFFVAGLEIHLHQGGAPSLTDGKRVYMCAQEIFSLLRMCTLIPFFGASSSIVRTY